MGLSASQCRYLSLTARLSDLEFQAQSINTARMNLATRSADAAKAYTEAMNNKVIRVADYSNNTDGTTTKIWSELTFSNAASHGYQIMGIGGNSLVPSPYKEFAVGQEISADVLASLPESVRSKFAPSSYDVQEEFTMYTKGTKVSDDDFQKLYAGHKGKFDAKVDADGNHIVTEDIIYTPSTSPMTYEQYCMLSSENQAKCAVRGGTLYQATSFVRVLNDEYKGMDIQSLLVSGVGQVVTTTFFNFLVEHGYGTGKYFNVDEGGNRTETTYEKLVEEFQNDAQTRSVKTVVDWRADESNMFKQALYTEDDAAALALYEAATAEIQAKDKELELQVKRIETEHNAVQTEMESVKKVIEKNIEQTFKTFG
ncbi:MAG: hypothetical protein K6A44_00595 [bacterium]|nr:hypothetical protein [bacterium]